MTEQEWLGCTDPSPMLNFLRGKTTGRKARLFATACVRRVARHWGGSAGLYPATLDENERYADDYPRGQETIRELQRRVAGELEELSGWHSDEFPYHHAAAARAMRLVLDPTGLDLDRIRRHVLDALGDLFPPPFRDDEERVMTGLARDIFGNPFRPLAVRPSWRTPSVLSLAQAAYDERIAPDPERTGWLTLDPARLLILADALEDAGCDEQQILEHLRGPGEHVRGCFALDLVLERG